MKLIAKAPRGTQDVLPSESYKWQYIEARLRRMASLYGFSEIRFPTFEDTALFVRGVGDTTDVVQKEMYTVTAKGDSSFTLRPEGTASVARSFLEHSLYAGVLPLKVYYIAPNFRHERPQSGRLREHHQFGVECFGADGPEADAEVISLADAFLNDLGITGVSLHINTIGCPACRPAYHAKLREYYEGRKEELCPTCLERLERNPLRLLDCKSPVCSEIAKGAPRSIDHLCPECAEHFEGLKGHLTAMGIDYVVDSGIVRGLDYYTKTVFEFISDALGAQSTVCGGGRYDGLIETLGGPRCSGLGFGSGLERLMLIMDNKGIKIPKPGGVDIYIAIAGGEESEEIDKTASRLARELRLLGASCERDISGRSLKAQMKYADKTGARHVIILGGDEIKAGEADLKDMSTGESVRVKLTAEDISAAGIAPRGYYPAEIR